MRAVAVPSVPYRGIQPFRYVDHAIFFAREEEARRLASLVAVYRGVMLYGDSGNGKSSLINAGLLPQITKLGFAVERVRVQPRAGEELVIERIATADDDDGEHLPSLLAAGDEAARVVLSTEEFEQRVRQAAGSQRLLIVFDQFEELLTLFEEPHFREARRRVVDLLVRLLREPLAIKLLFAFREDYLGRVKQLLGDAPELVDQALRLGPPAADALPTIIRGPFELYPGHFARELDAGLAERLREALSDRFGSGDLSLSEVQTVCLRLWQSEDPQTLLSTRGIRGLLEDYLGEALDAFAPDQRVAAIALLGQMVTSAGTRNVISADDLMQRVREEEDIPDAQLEQALARLESESRLVRRERRRDIYIYEITSEFLVPWISRRRDEARRSQERRRERRRAALALVVVAVLAGIAVWALGQRSDAQKQQTASTSLALAATSSTQLASRPDVALQLAFAAYRTSPRIDTRRSVVAALFAARGSGVLGILHGHEGTVYGVAFSPDGRILASASRDGTLRLWDVRTHRQLGKPLEGHAGSVYGVAFSPDGRTLASASGDRTVRLWDVRTHREIGKPLEGHKTAVFSVAFSPDGRTLASASDDATVRLWDARTHRPLGVLPQSVGTYGVAFSPDGRTLACAGENGIVQLWDARTQRRLGKPLRGHHERVVSVTFSPDGRTLASAGFDGTARLWSVRTHRPLGTPLSTQNSALYSVAFSRDGRMLAAAGIDKKVHLWDVRTHRQVSVLSGHAALVFGVAFSPDGHTLASGSNDMTIRLLDVRTQRGPLIGHVGDVLGVAFSPDGRTLASAGDDRTVRLWDARTHQQLAVLVDPAVSVAFSPDGRTLATAGHDRRVRLWDVRTYRPLGRPLRGHTAQVYSVAFSPDGRTLASSGADGTIRLWDVRTRRPRGTFTLRAKKVFAVAFSRDGTLASAAEDGKVRLWDVRARRQIGVLVGDQDFAYSLAFSRDGRTLASGGYDNTIRLWDVHARQPLGAPLMGHTESVFSVAFSPDGRTLTSSSADDTVRLWDVRTHEQIGTLPGFTARVFSIAISRNGTQAYGGAEPAIRLEPSIVWRNAAALRDEVCSLMGSGLSRAEWDRFGAGTPYRQSCA